MDGDAVLQDIILPELNDTNERHSTGFVHSGTLNRLRDDPQANRRYADDASVFLEEIREDGSSSSSSGKRAHLPTIILIAVSVIALVTVFTISEFNSLESQRICYIQVSVSL
ncbi:unnamed protein product [Anisakis simplex]|uniref:ECE1 n=1 Tax=Anisakis simplex TaxID=6269 RepID=A0A0M3JES9_ANISI|nr:unnamed protein product [Anisakis simplex]